MNREQQSPLTSSSSINANFTTTTIGAAGTTRVTALAVAAMMKDSFLTFKKSLRALDYLSPVVHDDSEQDKTMENEGKIITSDIDASLEQQDPEIESQDELAKEESPEPNPAEKLILDVMERCYYFSASSSLRDQVSCCCCCCLSNDSNFNTNDNNVIIIQK